MRQRLCRICGSWHDVETWPQSCMPGLPAMSDLPAPHCISDTMEPVQSQLDGQYYDSKSILRRTYREAGVVEVGNDVSLMSPASKTPETDLRSVNASVERAFSKAGLGA